jgi:hypothetical protein
LDDSPLKFSCPNFTYPLDLLCLYNYMTIRPPSPDAYAKFVQWHPVGGPSYSNNYADMYFKN